MTDETDMLPQRIHGGWPEVDDARLGSMLQALRESYERRKVERRFNIAFCLVAIICLSVIGWATIVGGAIELTRSVFP